MGLCKATPKEEEVEKSKKMPISDLRYLAKPRSKLQPVAWIYSIFGSASDKRLHFLCQLSLLCILQGLKAQ